jgi:hypothetical protein
MSGQSVPARKSLTKQGLGGGGDHQEAVLDGVIRMDQISN